MEELSSEIGELKKEREETASAGAVAASPGSLTESEGDFGLSLMREMQECSDELETARGELEAVKNEWHQLVVLVNRKHEESSYYYQEAQKQEQAKKSVEAQLAIAQRQQEGRIGRQ